MPLTINKRHKAKVEDAAPYTEYIRKKNDLFLTSWLRHFYLFLSSAATAGTSTLPGKLCSLRVLARNVLPSMTTFSQGPEEMSPAAFSSWRRGWGEGGWGGGLEHHQTNAAGLNNRC